MTVLYFRDYIDDLLDKAGTAYFTTEEKLKRVKTATYSFLEQNKGFIQYNQKAREDMSGVFDRFDITAFTTTPIGTFLYDMPNDFLGISSIGSDYNGVIRPLPIVQDGDWDKLNDDPFHTPTADEPLARFYSNKIETKPQPTAIRGIYMKHPTFGAVDGDELIAELPEQIQEFIVLKVAEALMTTTGDERFQMQYYQKENFS